MTDARPRILAIDDTPENLLTLGKAFEGEFDLQLATSGEQGLALAIARPPDLVLLDIMMPGMDGYEVCRRMIADPRLKNVPIVFVTAMTEIDAEIAGLALGAADYITKPINVAVARQRIHNLLERERLRKAVEAQRNHLEEMVLSRTAALAIAKEAAETANRAKTVFLANMSHELRTPLNGIMGLNSLALRRESDPKVRDMLGKIGKVSQNLLYLINDLLDISKIEAERMTLGQIPFMLGQVLENVNSLIAPRAAEKGLTLEIDAPEAVRHLIVQGDPIRLGQILLNLMGNAVKFTAAGVIHLEVQQLDAIEGKRALRFSVSDTGIGISNEDQSRIFNLFEQVDGSMTRQYGGTGLGLAICKRLVAMMNGQIGVNSAHGEGSTFWFTVVLDAAADLPAHTPPQPTIDSENELRTRHAGKRILLVEDEPINQMLISSLIEEAGLVADLAVDGLDALELVRHNAYALVLMDLQMPRMNGIDAARALRRLPGWESIPIVAISANVYEEDRLHCLDAGMNDFIGKPAGEHQLFDTLLRWLDQGATRPEGQEAHR